MLWTKASHNITHILYWPCGHTKSIMSYNRSQQSFYAAGSSEWGDAYDKLLSWGWCFTVNQLKRQLITDGFVFLLSVTSCTVIQFHIWFSRALWFTIVLPSLLWGTVRQKDNTLTYCTCSENINTHRLCTEGKENFCLASNTKVHWANCCNQQCCTADYNFEQPLGSSLIAHS